jgi:ribosome biogenesis GTPase
MEFIKGTIIKGIGGFYYVKTADEVIECKARGIFRKENITPLVGDMVMISTEDKKTGVIDEILPRCHPRKKGRLRCCKAIVL